LIIRSAASRAHRNTPVRLTSMTACHCASVIFPTTRPSLTLIHVRLPLGCLENRATTEHPSEPQANPDKFKRGA
jgi:hypothetical protein